MGENHDEETNKRDELEDMLLRLTNIIAYLETAYENSSCPHDITQVMRWLHRFDKILVECEGLDAIDVDTYVRLRRQLPWLNAYCQWLGYISQSGPLPTIILIIEFRILRNHFLRLTDEVEEELLNAIDRAISAAETSATADGEGVIEVDPT